MGRAEADPIALGRAHERNARSSVSSATTNTRIVLATATSQRASFAVTR